VVERFQKLDEQAGDEDLLNKFFDTLKIRYNFGYEVEPEMKAKIEKYFRYRWLTDRNQAIDEPEELAYLDQLPIDTQNMLYRDFLYQDFLHEFRYMFMFKKPDGEAYTWSDQPYRDFMLGLLQNFEPRLEEKGTIIYKELEEIQEVFFQEKGTIDIGYEINRKARFVLRMHKGAIIGAYNCSENKKMAFVFKSTTDVHGFMLRKHIWLDLLESVPELSSNLKSNIKVQYVKNIYIKVMLEKRKYLDKLHSKSLNNQVISVLDLKK